MTHIIYSFNIKKHHTFIKALAIAILCFCPPKDGPCTNKITSIFILIKIVILQSLQIQFKTEAVPESIMPLSPTIVSNCCGKRLMKS